MRRRGDRRVVSEIGSVGSVPRERRRGDVMGVNIVPGRLGEEEDNPS